MAVAEVRTQIYLEKAQHEALKHAAEERAVSMAQVVREAIESYLEAGVGPEADIPEAVYLSDPAWGFVETAEEIGGSGGGEDASRMEEELYGPIQT